MNLGRKLIILAGASLLLTAPLGIRLTQAQHAASASAAPARLYIVLVPGLCGPSNSDCAARTNAATRARSTFHLLLGAMKAAHIRFTPVYYSYNGRGAGTYSPADTRQAVPVSVGALNRQLRAVLTRDPTGKLDLVGYSLGGVVAASWAVTVGRRNSLRRVHSIVTLDSPLKGVHLGPFGAIARQFFGDSVINSLVPTSSTIRTIIAYSSSWWRSAGHLHTVANTADLLVPPSQALLGYTHTVTDRQCRPDILTLALCHGAVLEDAALSRFIACRWITNASQCAAPLPTPTPQPTATATPTVTATPEATATPVATMTSTPSVGPPPPP